MFDENLISNIISHDNIIFILSGVGVTLKYSSVAIIFGGVFGFILAMLKTLDNKIICGSAHIYSSIFRGTPLLIQLSIVHFIIVPALLGKNMDVFLSGAIAFSLNSAAYVSEIVRSGINSVDKGQVEAARALGISPLLCMKDIILPQAIRKILPALVNEWINLIKESAIISVIGGMDLMQRANIVSAQMFSYFEPLLIAAISYYIIVLIVSKIALIIEAKLAL